MEPPNYRTVRFLAVCLLTLATLRQINAHSDPEWVQELKLGECILFTGISVWMCMNWAFLAVKGCMRRAVDIKFQ